jgi:hypothetical protein
MTLASKLLDRRMLPSLMVLDLTAGAGLWRVAVAVAAARLYAICTSPLPDPPTLHHLGGCQ